MKLIHSFFYIAYLICAFSIPAHGNISKLKQNELTDIQKKITDLKQAQSVSMHKNKTLTQELKKIDLNISKTSLTLQKIEVSIEEKNQELNQIKKELDGLQKEFHLAQNQLSSTLLLSNKLGTTQPIALLLNQKDPTLTNRLITYISYINKDQIKILKKTQRLKKHIKDKNSQALEHVQKQQVVINEHKRLLVSLNEDQKLQKDIIHSLTIKMDGRTKKIKQLAADKQKLQQLIKKITTKKRLAADKVHFYRLKHKLPWPIETRFIKGKTDVEIKVNGLYLNGGKGRQVYAVRTGKVVFSDWLRGYGLLMILQHDHGFMTLYANTQMLYKEKGQMVYTGEKIATTGHSGGQLNDGLYFEIRHNAKPLPPLSWLVKR